MLVINTRKGAKLKELDYLKLFIAEQVLIEALKWKLCLIRENKSYIARKNHPEI